MLVYALQKSGKKTEDLIVIFRDWEKGSVFSSSVSSEDVFMMDLCNFYNFLNY